MFQKNENEPNDQQKKLETLNDTENVEKHPTDGKKHGQVSQTTTSRRRSAKSTTRARPLASTTSASITYPHSSIHDGGGI